MDPISRKLGQALLNHHQATTQMHPPGPYIVEGKYMISYGALCAKAGAPMGILPIIGRYLLPIAEWCERAGYPALNALAVSDDTGIPGGGYDSAGGFAIVDWPEEVKRCIRFAGYPPEMP